MPPKKWIDKKKADTYSLVYRSQEDPLINDPDASQRVLVKLDNLNNAKQKQERRDKWAPVPHHSNASSKILTAEILAEEEENFRKQGRRDNEGEAALYGIEFDDSKYDYMQHLKPIGEDPSAVFISKKSATSKEKQNFGKDGDLLLKSDYATANKVNLPSDVLPSNETVKRTYQDQQDIPDEIAGLQPDMDPSLREVLEALEDEEYVDDDEDIFDALITSGKAPERSADEWADYDPENDYSGDDYSDDEGYDSDANQQSKFVVTKKEGEEDWETAFRQFKLDQSKSKAPIGQESDDEFDEERDEVASLSQVPSGRRITKSGRKQKIGAKTDLTGFSMSSSALFRNDGLTLLDNRFDKIEEEYNKEDEDEGEDEGNEPFDMSKERDDLEAIMDDFLDNYVVEGKKMYKK